MTFVRLIFALQTINPLYAFLSGTNANFYEESLLFCLTHFPYQCVRTLDTPAITQPIGSKNNRIQFLYKNGIILDLRGK